MITLECFLFDSLDKAPMETSSHKAAGSSDPAKERSWPDWI